MLALRLLFRRFGIVGGSPRGSSVAERRLRFKRCRHLPGTADRPCGKPSAADSRGTGTGATRPGARMAPPMRFAVRVGMRSRMSSRVPPRGPSRRRVRIASSMPTCAGRRRPAGTDADRDAAPTACAVDPSLRISSRTATAANFVPIGNTVPPCATPNPTNSHPYAGTPIARSQPGWKPCDPLPIATRPASPTDCRR